MQATPEETIAQIYPLAYRKMVVALTAYFGFASIARAEDLVQDTFATAIEEWRKKGIPQYPEKWLYKVCKNKALNSQKSRQAVPPRGYAPAQSAAYQLEEAFSENEIEDRELRMIFACCHPRFSTKAQLVLILKTLCGFSSEQTADCLAMKTEALRKLHYRTLQLIKEEQITLHTPHLLRLKERTENVHRAIYLLFDEGYLAYQGPELFNCDASQEALRLIRLMLRHPAICTADTYALYALFLFHLSRLEARSGPDGEIIELEQQNRSYWQKDLIQLGIQQLNKSRQHQKVLSRYILEALIASLHCTAPAFKETDWHKISGFYELLLHIAPGPFVSFNKAVALYFSQGADAAIASIETSAHHQALQEQHLYHSFLGRLFHEKGETERAGEHYLQAIARSRNQQEKAFIQKKLEALRSGIPRDRSV